MNIHLSVVTPIINLNGNSKTSLVDEWTEFADALEDVLEKFPFESFNGRNWQNRDVRAWSDAMDSKSEILSMLRNLKHTAVDVAVNLQEQ